VCVLPQLLRRTQHTLRHRPQQLLARASVMLQWVRAKASSAFAAGQRLLPPRVSARISAGLYAVVVTRS
jgi:hypothetical protein